MLTPQQISVHRAIMAPETTYLAIETTPGSGLIRLLLTARTDARNLGFEMYGLGTSFPTISLLREAIPTTENVFAAIEKHRKRLFRDDCSDKILVVHDAGRLEGKHFDPLISFACEAGFAKTVLFFTKSFGFDLRSEPSFRSLVSTGMPVLAMTQIVRT